MIDSLIKIDSNLYQKLKIGIEFPNYKLFNIWSDSAQQRHTN